MLLTRSLVHRIRHPVRCRSNKQKNKFIKNKLSNSLKKRNGERAMCHPCERNVARRILLYFRAITQVLEERRTATEREEDGRTRAAMTRIHDLYLDLDSGNPLFSPYRKAILIISPLTRCCKTAR